MPSVAVVGCGYWGRNLVRNFHAVGVLAAVCDSDSAVAAEVGREFDVPYRTLEALLTDADIAAVAIATPALLHFEVSLRAIEAGKHVFVEKPLALRVDEAERLCDLAERHGRILMVGHLLQYHPGFLRLKKIVDDGLLGRVQYLYSNRLNLGRIRREEDILWSFAPHDLSMILSIVRAEPSSVWAVGGAYLHRSIADVTTTHMMFPGGEQAHVFVSWLHPVKEQRLVVVGDRGMAVFDDGEDWSRKVQVYGHRIDWKEGRPQAIRAVGEAVPVEPEEPLAAECRHFCECIRDGTTPRTDGLEGARVLRVLERASQSMLVENANMSPPSHLLDVFVHESAYVDDGADVGPGTKIWHFSHVMSGSRIGRDCVLGQNVMVGERVVIGDRCKLQNNVSVYTGVSLGDGVFCGPSAVFTNVVNPRAQIERKDEFRPTRVGAGATIGANATIVCGNDIGGNAFVAAGAVVTRGVPPHALVAGVPARRIGWMSHDGHRLGDDLVCPRTGRRYREVSGRLEEIG